MDHPLSGGVPRGPPTPVPVRGPPTGGVGRCQGCGATFRFRPSSRSLGPSRGRRACEADGLPSSRPANGEKSVNPMVERWAGIVCRRRVHRRRRQDRSTCDLESGPAGSVIIGTALTAQLIRSVTQIGLALIQRRSAGAIRLEYGDRKIEIEDASRETEQALIAWLSRASSQSGRRPVGGDPGGTRTSAGSTRWASSATPRLAEGTRLDSGYICGSG